MFTGFTMFTMMVALYAAVMYSFVLGFDVGEEEREMSVFETLFAAALCVPFYLGNLIGKIGR